MSGKKIREIIISYLSGKGNYQMSDDLLIDEVVFNVQVMNNCKFNIRAEGYKINITQNPEKEPYWVKSQDVLVYYMALKEIKGLFQQLGITPKDRIRLQLDMKEADIDEFDSVFS